MTIANQTNRISAVGAGAVLNIPYAFPTTASGDLKVIMREISTGDPTEFTEGAASEGYTATYGSGGGSVTTSDSIASTHQVHVIRDTDMTQTLDLEQGDDFSAPDIETAFDKNTKLIIENADQLDRTLKFPDTDPSSSFADMPNSIDRADKNLTFDSDGKPTASVSVEEGSVSFTAIGTDIAEAANATAVRTLLELGWLDVRALIASGAGTSGDPWVISDVSAYANVYFVVAGYYKLSANWNIISNSHMWGTKGVFLDPDTYTLECSGTVSATTTDFTADGAKSATSLTVADESSFSADDWIEISASKDVYPGWASRTLPRELNQVASTAANTINLKYPLQREYDYDAGYTDQPTVTKITTLKENVIIENINIQGNIDFGYVRNLSIRGITTEILTFAEVVKSFEIINVEASLPVATDDIGLIVLYGASEGIISVRTYGTGNGIFLWGCSEITGNVIVKQCHFRAVWIYGSDDINLSPVIVLGTKTNAANIEILLIDYSGSCSIRNAFVKEINKTGDANIFESRENLGLCEFTDSEVYGYSTSLITIKVKSLHTIIDRNKIHVVSNVTEVMRLSSEDVAYATSIIKLRDNEVLNDGDTASFLRTPSGTVLTTNNIKFVEVSGNKIPLETGGYLCNLRASSGSKGIETLIVINNICEIITQAGIYRGDENFLVTNLVYHGNTTIRNKATAPNFAGVTNVISTDDTVMNKVCNENQVVCNENLIVTN